MTTSDGGAVSLMSVIVLRSSDRDALPIRRTVLSMTMRLMGSRSLRDMKYAAVAGVTLSLPVMIASAKFVFAIVTKFVVAVVVSVFVFVVIFGDRGFL